MLEQYAPSAILAAIVYIVIVWLLWEAGMATQLYYNRVHVSGKEPESHNQAIVTHALFVFPAVFRLGRFWWQEYWMHAGDNK